VLGGPIYPKYWKLFDPFAFSLTKAFAQAVEDGVVVDLDLVICK